MVSNTSNDAIARYLNTLDASNHSNSQDRLVVEKNGVVTYRQLSFFESILAKFGFGPASFKNVVTFCHTHSQDLKLNPAQKIQFLNKIREYNNSHAFPIKKINDAYCSFLELTPQEEERIKKVDKINKVLKSENPNNDALDRALLEAVWYNFPDLIEPLIKKGAKPDAKDGYGNQQHALTYAVYYATPEIAEKLLTLGATTLQEAAKAAAEKCKPDFITLFLDRGLNVNTVFEPFGSTLLLQAAQSIAANPTKTLEALIEKGANVNSQNKSGQTALHLIISAEPRVEPIKMLLKSKTIDVTIKDNEGRTPLDLARVMLAKENSGFGNTLQEIITLLEEKERSNK